MEINVIDWKTGEPRQVCISFPELGQMLTISAEDARTMAFMLMQCADFIEPPFDGVKPLSADDNEEESFFGPYEDPPSNQPDDDEEDDLLDN